MAIGDFLSKRTSYAVAALAAVTVFLSTDWPLRLELAGIRFYRAHLSPIAAYTARCRFHPSCSAYGLLVLQRDGFWKGNAELALRLLRCSAPGYLVDYLRGALPPEGTLSERETGPDRRGENSGGDNTAQRPPHPQATAHPARETLLP